MTFVLFLLLTATLFLRPAELLPELQGWSIYEALIIGCLLGSYERIREQLRPAALVREPITLCIVALMAAVVLSHATHAYLGGVQACGEAYLKTILYYFLLLSQVNTPQRIRTFAMVTAICASLMVLLCTVDYLGIVDFEFVTHVSDRDGQTEEGETAWVQRMRGTGIFEDPNDISLVIVAAGVLCFYFLNDPEQGPARAIWLAPIGLMVLAMLFTRSRGGLLATGAAAITVVYLQKGKWAALGLAACGAATLPIVAGRQAEISLGAGTAAERMEMWREGFEALKSADGLFGIGMGTYADIAGLVAHNSYLHAFVELGIIGGTFFVGCFFFAFLAIYRISRTPVSDSLQQQMRESRALRELVRLQPYAAAVVANWAMGLFSLSRCYVVPTYLVFGLISAYVVLWQQHVNEGRLVVWFDRSHALKMAGSSLAVLAGLYVLVRLG